MREITNPQASSHLNPSLLELTNEILRILPPSTHLVPNIVNIYAIVYSPDYTTLTHKFPVRAPLGLHLIEFVFCRFLHFLAVFLEFFMIRLSSFLFMHRKKEQVNTNI